MIGHISSFPLGGHQCFDMYDLLPIPMDNDIWSIY